MTLRRKIARWLDPQVYLDLECHRGVADAYREYILLRNHLYQLKTPRGADGRFVKRARTRPVGDSWDAMP